jgi:hypothetical protein
MAGRISLLQAVAIMKTFILRNDVNLDNVKRGIYKTLKELNLDKPMKVTVSEYKENKTYEQRSAFHMLCRFLGEELGYNENDMKQAVVAEVYGSSTVLGHEVYQSTEKLKREDYSILITQIYIIAAGMGIVLPPIGRQYV